MRPLWKDDKRISTQIISIETERRVSYFIDMYIWQFYISRSIFIIIYRNFYR
jgi:hypothetical protein